MTWIKYGGRESADPDADIRAAFERHYGDVLWPAALERNADGSYRLMQTATAWHYWRNGWNAAIAKP